jgi:hypothetical protein
MTRSTFNRETQKIVDAIVAVFEKFEPPLTVRQVYYQIATLGLVPLSQLGYRQVQRLCVRVRELEIVDWENFADRTRDVIQWEQWDGVSEYAQDVARWYRRDYWRTQPDHVEFWLEKDALSEFIGNTTRPLGVPLYTARGFASVTFIHEAAAALENIDKPKFIYYLGDHDPSGISIEKSLCERLEDFGADFHFRRLAVTLDDIEAFNLKPLQAKKTDSRYQSYKENFGDQTIELDALPPNELRRRVTSAIHSHINHDEWKRLERVEALERNTIRSIADRIGSAA